MERIVLCYQGEARTEATQTSSGATLLTDAAKEDGGSGEEFSPTSLLATALGSCILTILGLISKNRQIELGNCRVEVTKEMSSSGPYQVKRLATTVHLPASMNEKDRLRLERGARTCPVHRSLHPDIDAPIDFAYE